MSPVVAVLPPMDPLARAVNDGGGAVGPADQADAIVWTDAGDAEGLRRALDGSPARWVQLPFAGIERFFEAGVIDPARTWTCAKGIYGEATAEHALALMLAATRLIHRHARDRRWWGRGPDSGHRRIAGTTALVVGTGGIGRALTAMLAPLRVRVLGCNRSGAPLPGAERTVPVDGLDEVLPEADWVVLCTALTPSTRGLIGADRIALMKPAAWIVNVARGGLVDTGALVDSLRGRRIGGAALDVTDPEPLPAGHPLWDMDDVIVTSHTANTFEMALPELTALVARNVRAFARGDPLEGLVDPALGY